MEASRVLRVAGRADHDVICRWLRRCADVCGLRDYTVEVSPDPPADPNDFMTVTVHPLRKLARFAACEAFMQLQPDDQRHFAAHELAHVHVEALASRVRQDLQPELSPAAWRVFWSGFCRDIEHTVDGLAVAIAPLLPLPENVK